MEYNILQRPEGAQSHTDCRACVCDFHVELCSRRLLHIDRSHILNYLPTVKCHYTCENNDANVKMVIENTILSYNIPHTVIRIFTRMVSATIMRLASYLLLF